MKKLTITLTILLFAVATIFAQDINEQLFEAVKDNNLQKVEELIEKGADVNAKSKNDYTPLHYACRNENSFGIVILK